MRHQYKVRFIINLAYKLIHYRLRSATEIMVPRSSEERPTTESQGDQTDILANWEFADYAIVTSSRSLNTSNACVSSGELPQSSLPRKLRYK